MKRLILILALASMACQLQSAPATSTPQVPTPILTSTVVDVEAGKGEAPSPSPTPAARDYTVSAYRLWVRDMDMMRVEYLSQGDPVTCMPTDSGWCIMEQGRRVWAGCLDPNPKQLGCEAR